MTPKDNQKQLITEIMNEDAKDGLYKQQTAVEWLEERFQKFVDWTEGNHKAEPYTISQLLSDFEHAKEMHREQIEKAVIYGNRQEYYDGTETIASDYYTQTYGE